MTGSVPANGSTEVAVAVVEALLRAGVIDVVLAPGSRSAGLAVILHQADADGRLRLHVRVDERTAGFLALGLAKGSHRPTAVVTTSGTAVANLHPAVLEAVHAGVRLIVVSADRPAELRGTGANQTTEQVGMFGPRVPVTDVVAGDAAAAGGAIGAATVRPGPSHVNLQLAEPLLPERLPVPLSVGPTPDAPARWVRYDAASAGPAIEQGPRTVVVAGDDAGPPARFLAQVAEWPLLAEPTSGSRTGTHAIRAGRLLLGTELGGAIERVVVVGHPTLSRPVTRLISNADVEVVAVRAPAGYPTDPGRVARHLDTVPGVSPGGPAERTWLDSWRAADRDLGAALDVLAGESGAAPLAVARSVAEAVGPGGMLVVGSSQPVRDLDLMMAPYPAGERRLLIGNRGLAGIDGTLSTAIGAALGRSSTRALAYVGDVTFLHDVTGLVIGPDEPVPDLTVVVANDDGGAIFGVLEQGAPTYAGSFERVFGTPHGVRLADLCTATGVAYQRVEADRLAAALAEPVAGLRVLEVPLERRGRRDLEARVQALL